MLFSSQFIIPIFMYASLCRNVLRLSSSCWDMIDLRLEQNWPIRLGHHCVYNWLLFRIWHPEYYTDSKRSHHLERRFIIFNFLFPSMNVKEIFWEKKILKITILFHSSYFRKIPIWYFLKIYFQNSGKSKISAQINLRLAHNGPYLKGL